MKTNKTAEQRKDPLTATQRREFERQILQEFRRAYDKALRCGAFPESCFEKGDHLMARCAVVAAAQEIGPQGTIGKKHLENFLKF